MRAMISGIGHYYPNRKLTNQDLENMVDTSDEWISTRTGIKERRILDPDKGTSYMAVRAAQMVLDQRGISAQDLDLIIMATVTPDMTVPPCSAMVQKELGAANAWGFDLNGACTGFLYALTVGTQFIESGKHQKVMVIGADKMSAIIDYTDRNTCILFGDAAGALLLEPAPDDSVGIQDSLLKMDGTGDKHLYLRAGGSLFPASQETIDARAHYLFQDGKVVFKHAVNGMHDVVSGILERNNLTPDRLKLLIPHQANFRIIDSVAKKMGLSQAQVMVNIHKFGNTTNATIPLAMSEAYQAQRIQKGDWIVLTAFGAGFTWGSLLSKWALD